MFKNEADIGRIIESLINIHKAQWNQEWMEVNLGRKGDEY
jgi:hypothetical protein